MVYNEGNVWSSLIVSIAGVAAYTIIMWQRASTQAITEIDWVAPMLWTIGLSIAGAIVISIAWGIITGIREPGDRPVTDLRDREISRMGDRVGTAFLVIAGLGVLALSAIEADHFWIAHAMFFGFATSAIIGGIAQVIAYRRGLV